MQDKLISVIIPTYMPGQYLYDCLSSLKCQSIQAAYFDIFLILNGPLKPYSFLIDNWVNDLDMKNLQLHYCKEVGVSNARNYGMELNNSEYIAFIDDDDFVSPNYLTDLLALTTESKNSIIISNLKTIEDSQIGDDYISKAFAGVNDRHFNLIRFRKFFSNVPGKLIPREVIGSNKFNPNLTIREDALFMFSISKNISLVKKASDECIYFRRIRADSASRKEFDLKKNFSYYINSLKCFTITFASDPFKYNVIFYATRILAINKSFIKSFWK